MTTRLPLLRKYGLPTLAGLCLGVSLVHIFFWPLVFVGGVLSIYIFYNADSKRAAVIVGCIIGTTKMAIVLSWGLTTHPLEWVGVDAPLIEFVLICLYWLPSAVALGSGMAALGYLSYWLFHKRYHFVIMLLSVATLWVLAEVVGAIVFSVFMLGPGSTINANFSFGHTGYALVSHQVFFEFAALLGVYSLSFVVGLVSILLYYVYQYSWRWRHVFVGVLLVSSMIPIGSVYGTSSSTDVAVVGTELSFTMKELSSIEEAQDQLLQALHTVAEVPSEYVVFPEDAGLLNSFVTTDSELRYLTELGDTPRVYVDSGRLDIEGETVLRAYVYDTRAGEVYEFDKQYLVPQGEYLPFVYRGFIRSIARDHEVLQDLEEDITYRPGISQTVLSLPSYAPAVLFCFESVAPFGVRRAIGDRTEVPFVAHIVSHAWFEEPQTLWNQLDAMLLTQAKFNSVPIIEAANMAPSKVYYPDGSIVYPTPEEARSVWSVGRVEL